MKLSLLLDCDKYDVEVSRTTHDVNQIDENTLLFLFDGEDIERRLELAIAKCPAAIITDYKTEATYGIPIIFAENARYEYARLTSKLMEIDYGKIKFIGVTGTNGKTSTAILIYEIFKHTGYKTGLIGTGKIVYMDEIFTENNYSMTTPDPPVLYAAIKRMQSEGCEVIVMEVSSHSLKYEKCAPIFFEASVFTNLSEEHLDFHCGMEDYYQTKLSLFSKSKIGIFNIDDKYSARAASDSNGKCNVHTVGIKGAAEAMARRVESFGIDGSLYLYKEEKFSFLVNLSLPGEHNIYNSLMALKCAITMGIRPCEAKAAITSVQSIDGRFEIIRGDVTVIIDYAHTPKAFENILKTANSIKVLGQNIITVFGCGGNRDASKRPKMAEIAEKYSDKVIVTEDNSRTEELSNIINDILDGFSTPLSRSVITSRKSAIKNAILSSQSGDIILILGKGHERYSIDKSGYHTFDEREIVHEALSIRKEALLNAN